MTRPTPAPRPARSLGILVVCTANRCRSPMAAALLGRDLARAGVVAEVSSCGLLDAGSPAPPEVVDAMAALGLDVRDHRSRTLSPYAVDGADLVVAMAREHLREVVAALPAAFGRTFTLKEIVRLGTADPPTPGSSLPAWLEALSQGRRPQDLLGSSPADDVDDPIGGPYRGYQQTAAELAALTDRLATLLAALEPGDGEAR